MSIEWNEKRSGRKEVQTENFQCIYEAFPGFTMKSPAAHAASFLDLDWCGAWAMHTWRVEWQLGSRKRHSSYSAEVSQLREEFHGWHCELRSWWIIFWTPERLVCNGEFQEHTDPREEHAPHTQPVLSNRHPILVLPLHISPFPTWCWSKSWLLHHFSHNYSSKFLWASMPFFK